MVLAFRWTNITSVTLLDSFSIPVAVALSALVLGARYRAQHYAGAAICVAGLLVLLLGDREGGTSGTSAGAVLGDCLVLLGASLYAAANVAQERLLGGAPPGEVLAMLGLLGSALSLAQGLPLELAPALAAAWSPATALAAAGYTAALLAFYSLVPRLLILGGAALLNLSLLSSDVWAAGARALFFGEQQRKGGGTSAKPPAPDKCCWATGRPLLLLHRLAPRAGGFSRLSGLYFLLAFALVALGLALFTRGGEVVAAAQEQPEAVKRQKYHAVPPLAAGPRLDGPERSIELEPEEGGSLRGSPMQAALPPAAALGSAMVHFQNQQRHASDESLA